MTMAYFATFDVLRGGAGTLTLSTAGKSDIVVSLTTFLNSDGPVTTFNHLLNNFARGFGPYEEETLLGFLPDETFFNSVQTYARAQATTLTWSNPNSITLDFNTTTWRLTFQYTNSFTAIAFSNTETRRLFGFSGNFSGSSASVAGTQLPKYVIVPVIDSASSVSIVHEDDAISSNASSAAGRTYGLTRSGTLRKRTWVQQYETKKRTYRMFADPAPDEFTYQHLFEACRTGLPFGVYGGFGENESHAYSFQPGSESFHAKPATPGNANQFHIPFDTFAIGRL